MRKQMLLLYLLLVTLLCIYQQPQRADAHAAYDHAEPSSAAILTTPPTVVRIWFTEELFRREGVNGIEVYDATGARVDLDDAAIDDDDRSLMTVSLVAELPAGLYTVRWKTLSADADHEGSGEYNFTIESGATARGPAATTMAESTAAVTITTTVAQPTSAITITSVVPKVTTSPIPTAAPTLPLKGLPCLGGALPLVIFMALEFGGQRRHGSQRRKP